MVDTDVATAHHAQGCTLCSTSDGDVAGTLDGRDERCHLAVANLDVARTLDLRHRGPFDVLDGDVTRALDAELRVLDAACFDIAGLHTGGEVGFDVTDIHDSAHAVGTDRGSLGNLDDDLGVAGSTTTTEDGYSTADDDAATDGADAHATTA